jgi:hypothetical protein
MIHKTKPKFRLVYLGLLLVLGMQPSSQADGSRQFTVLTAEPLPQTYINVYQDIKELFVSDTQLVLIAELDSNNNPKHTAEIQILNSKGEIAYDQEMELETKPGYRKPYVACRIAFDSELKSRLIPGFISIKLHLDGNSFPIKQLTYRDQSIIKKQIAKLVVLPFYSTTNQLFDYKSKNAILNTFSEALTFEVQRYFPNLFPADSSIKDLSGLNLKNCFENADCRNNLTKIFKEGIFISGNVSLPAASKNRNAPESEVFLEVFLFDSRRNQTEKFKATYLIKQGDDPVELMELLAGDLLVKQGFLLYIRSIN